MDSEVVKRDLTPSPVMMSLSRRVMRHYSVIDWLDLDNSRCSGFSLWCWIWNLYWTSEDKWGWEHSGQSQSHESRHWTEQKRESDLATHCWSTLRYSFIPSPDKNILKIGFSHLYLELLIVLVIVRCLYGSLASVWKEGEKENSSSK